MVVIYLLNEPDPMDCTVHSIVPGINRLYESGGKLWADGVYRPLVDQASDVGWIAFPDQYVPPPPVQDPPPPDLGPGIIPPEIPRTVADLGLTPYAAETLPRSQVPAMLIAVNMGSARPATVRRRFQGANYDLACFVSQSIVDLWIGGALAIGDLVIVSYVEDIPDLPFTIAPIITDRVYKTW